jgi:hypothetical protein
MHRLQTLLSICLICIGLPTAQPLFAAEDTQAIALMRTFTLGCVASQGDLTRVRSFAELNNIVEMKVEGPFKTLMVDGGDGAMWHVETPSNIAFAATIQNKPETCTVWIESLDIAEMMDMFRRLRDNLEKRGVEAIIAKDEPLKTATGTGRLMMMTTYSMGNGEFVYTLAIADRPASLAPGTPFQAALELRAVKR